VTELDLTSSCLINRHKKTLVFDQFKSEIFRQSRENGRFSCVVVSLKLSEYIDRKVTPKPREIFCPPAAQGGDLFFARQARRLERRASTLGGNDPC